MDLRREKKRAIMRYAGYVAGTLGVGGLSALLSRGGMEAFAHLKKPSFSAGLGVSGGVDASLHPDGSLRGDDRRRENKAVARRAFHLLCAALR